MTLEVGIACAGLAISVVTPFISQWLALHASTKDDYRRLLGTIWLTVGLTYSAGMLSYLLGNDEPITKSYIFKLTLYVLTVVIYLIVLVAAKLFKLIRTLTDMDIQLIESHRQLVAQVSDVVKIQLQHAEASQAIATEVFNLTSQAEAHLDALEDTLPKWARRNKPPE